PPARVHQFGGPQPGVEERPVTALPVLPVDDGAPRRELVDHPHVDGDVVRSDPAAVGARPQAMPVASPVSERLTVVSLLLLTFATGIVDAGSVLALGHVFVANMTGNIIFLGFWFVPHSGVDMTSAVVAFVSFVAGTVLGGRLARHIDSEVRLWLTVALGMEVVVLLTLSILASAGVLNYHDNTKLILTAGLAMTFGSQ